MNVEDVIILLSFVFIIAILLSIRHRNNKILQRNIELLKTVTTTERGTWSERDLIIDLLKMNIPSQAIFHDLYVRQPGGNYSQIDVVVLTKAGIIVFEVKDYSGWLFGKGYQSHWCQVLAYGEEKHRFYNPVKQNETHITCLKQNLEQCISANTPIYSVIVFYGNCVFKDISSIPDNTFVIKHHALLDVMEYIMNQDINANYLNKREMVRLLREAVKNGENTQIVAQHSQMVRNIANRN